MNNKREIDIIAVGKGGGGEANQNLVSSQLSSSSEVIGLPNRFLPI